MSANASTADTQTSAQRRFLCLLHELFQFDRADLDFGIYRILNQKRDEIASFIEKDLLPQVQQAIGTVEDVQRTEIERNVRSIEEQAALFHADPANNPEYVALKFQLDNQQRVADIEHSVFSDLYTFFSRNYD